MLHLRNTVAQSSHVFSLTVGLAFPLHKFLAMAGRRPYWLAMGYFRPTKTKEKIMSTDTKILTREEIFALAQQARLMLVDGGACYLNDMATEKELIALVRLVESALAMKQPASSVKD